jgi:hypothetical protein
MYDDDDILYFVGRLICPSGNHTGFEPLDDFGDSFGCTYIQYLNENDVWETL